MNPPLKSAFCILTVKGSARIILFSNLLYFLFVSATGASTMELFIRCGLPGVVSYKFTHLAKTIKVSAVMYIHRARRTDTLLISSRRIAKSRLQCRYTARRRQTCTCAKGHRALPSCSARVLPFSSQMVL